MNWLMLEYMKPPEESDPMWIQTDYDIIVGPSYSNWQRYLEQIGWSGNTAVSLKKRLDILSEA
jgi:hypothetical protein